MKLSCKSFCAVLAFSLAMFSAAQLSAQEQTQKLVPMFKAIPPAHPVNVQQMQKLAQTGAALPTWSGSFSYNGNNYPYTIMGTDPSKGSATSIIKFGFIPLAIKFPDGTVLDPTKPTQCGGTQSALNITLQSPMFKAVNWTQGGTNVGTTQYIDAFQRAEFWDSVSTVAPNYHVLLSNPVVAPVQTMNAPPLLSHTAAGSCGKYGTVDIYYYEVQLELILQRFKQINPGVFPYVITYDVFETETGQCCVLGYHTVSLNNVVYGTGAYNDQNIFGGANLFTDIVTISHEIGEAFNDPYINNNSPSWLSSYAPQYGCNSTFEVGDPLAGLGEPVALNGHTYYVQDMAFLPWFEKAGSSGSVNGWYSMYGTFTSGSDNCSN
jgi:hypothetical protein